MGLNTSICNFSGTIYIEDGLVIIGLEWEKTNDKLQWYYRTINNESLYYSNTIIRLN